MKKYFLVAAISMLPHWVLAAQPDGTCPGRAVVNISDYNIPAGSFLTPSDLAVVTLAMSRPAMNIVMQKAIVCFSQ